MRALLVAIALVCLASLTSYAHSPDPRLGGSTEAATSRVKTLRKELEHLNDIDSPHYRATLIRYALTKCELGRRENGAYWLGKAFTLEDDPEHPTSIAADYLEDCRNLAVHGKSDSFGVDSHVSAFRKYLDGPTMVSVTATPACPNPRDRRKIRNQRITSRVPWHAPVSEYEKVSGRMGAAIFGGNHGGVGSVHLGVVWYGPPYAKQEGSMDATFDSGDSPLLAQSERKLVALRLSSFVEGFRKRYSLPEPNDGFIVAIGASWKHVRQRSLFTDCVKVGKDTISYYSRPGRVVVGTLPRRDDGSLFYGGLQHELAHGLLAELPFELPPWLEEGLAAQVELRDPGGTPEAAQDAWRQNYLEKESSSILTPVDLILGNNRPIGSMEPLRSAVKRNMSQWAFVEFLEAAGVLSSVVQCGVRGQLRPLTTADSTLSDWGFGNGTTSLANAFRSWVATKKVGVKVQFACPSRHPEGLVLPRRK